MDSKNTLKIKKRLFFGLKIFLMLLFLILLLFRIGIVIFQTPKSYMIWYFNNNYEDFITIAECLVSSDNSLSFNRGIADTRLYSDDNYSAVDKSVSSKIIKTLQLGNYCNIEYYSTSKSHKIEFRISNFTVRVGQPFGIVYSERKPSNWDGPDDFVLCYEKIRDNWYYCYRGKNREYGG